MFAVQRRAEEDQGVCTVGWALDATGRPSEGWGPWTEVGGWRSPACEAAAAAVLDRGGPTRPELMTVSVSDGVGRHRSSALALDVDDAATRGVWRLLDFDSEILAVHAALLHTGEVLFFSGSGADPDDHRAHRYRSRVWRYPRARFDAPRTPIDLFCAGQSFLEGGRLLVAGGTRRYGPFRGIRDALAFDPATRQWKRLRPMARDAGTRRC